MPSTIVDLGDLEMYAAQGERVTWQGREALRLESGLALVPTYHLPNPVIEVLVGVEGPAYAGVAFRIADVLNYELAYAVPHASGQWDALQYDPVWRGSNSWQLHYGPGYQGSAQVPIGEWFRLRVAVDETRAAISVDDQPPLVVEALARPVISGLCGLWTYRPACFAGLRIATGEAREMARGVVPIPPPGAVSAWFLEDYGALRCEANGALNICRELPISVGTARLHRRLAMPRDGILALEFGFSDTLALELDGELIFEGENTFMGMTDRAARGYAELGTHAVKRPVAAGVHRLTAKVGVKESFGWGLVLTALADDLEWLPVELG